MCKMETRTYECHYCKKEYIPKRRGVQKFCSNGCRVRAHQLKNKKLNNSIAKEEADIKQEKIKVEQMSFAGVGNAAVAMVIVNTITSLMTKFENKQAAKQDIVQLNLKLNKLIELMKKNESGLNLGFNPV